MNPTPPTLPMQAVQDTSHASHNMKFVEAFFPWDSLVGDEDFGAPIKQGTPPNLYDFTMDGDPHLCGSSWATHHVISPLILLFFINEKI